MFAQFAAPTLYHAAVDLKKLQFIYNTIKRHPKEYEDLKILEVACGKGGITLPLATLGCKVTAFDMNEENISHLQTQIASSAVKNIHALVADAFEFDDGQLYDIVIASEIFEHVHYPARLAKNITRHMTDGAILVVTTPNGYGPWEITNRMQGKYSKGRCTTGHVQFYTKRRLLKLFDDHCLTIKGFGKSDSILSTIKRFRRQKLTGKIDIQLADMLPAWMASGWYFALEYRPLPNTDKT